VGYLFFNYGLNYYDQIILQGGFNYIFVVINKKLIFYVLCIITYLYQIPVIIYIFFGTLENV